MQDIFQKRNIYIEPLFNVHFSCVYRPSHLNSSSSSSISSPPAQPLLLLSPAPATYSGTKTCSRPSAPLHWGRLSLSGFSSGSSFGLHGTSVDQSLLSGLMRPQTSSPADKADKACADSESNGD